MLHRADFHQDCAVRPAFYDREMFFFRGRIIRRRDELLHLLTATYNINTAVDAFENDISTHCAEEKSCCHSICGFNC